MTRYTHYHLIGIGGIGMSCIGTLLLSRGVQVSGSDIKEGKVTLDLARAGARIFIGHNRRNIAGADIIVYSSAITQDNPEIAEAKKAGIPLIKRAEALAWLMQDKLVITVAGSHGKTTTTSLVSYMLLEAGLEPTVAIGGILRNIDTNAFPGGGDFFVAEADESDGSFLCYHPTYSIVTNIDREHLDYYRSFDEEIKAFKEFLYHTAAGGCVFFCGDDANLVNMQKGYPERSVLFGFDKGCHIYAMNIQLQGLSSEFDCYYRHRGSDPLRMKPGLIGRFSLSLGGMHNISNALSVVGLGLELGINRLIIQKILAQYKGVGRRIEVKYSGRDLTIIDDYAHHPTEIKATLAAVKNMPCQRMIAVFQPHRYTRTKLLLDEFAGCFDAADYLIITDIYAAGELPIEGVHARSIYDKLIERFGTKKEIYYMPKNEIVGNLINVIAPGDIVIILGAGDIVKICDELVERFKVHSQAQRAS